LPRFPAYVILIHQRHRQTDRETACSLNTALCTSASRGKNYECVIMQVTKGALISVWKCIKSAWRPGSAWTHWGAYTAPPDP